MTDYQSAENRIKRIVRVSVVGILANLLLGLLKIFAGLASNSIAILSDAVNNFSDSFSSVVTIITMFIASRGATRQHPFGFGRIEYFSGAVIAVIVIITGGEFFMSSFNRIFNPVVTTYRMQTLIILAISVVAKIVLGRYTKVAGERENAPPLIASGEDSLSDAIITSVTLLGAIVAMMTSLNIDSYLGIFVSLVVIKAGIDMLWEIISSLLGERNQIDLAQTIIADIKNHDQIIGAYDLILHNYGPNIYIGDCNVELPDSMTIREAYAILKPIRHHVMETYGVLLYIGFYSVNTTDQKTMEIEQQVKSLALKHTDVLQIHAFTIYEELSIMAFDIVADFDCKNLDALKKAVIDEVATHYPNYKVKATMERDFSFSD